MNLTIAQQLKQATDPHEIGRLQAQYQIDSFPHDDSHKAIARSWRSTALAMQKTVKSDAKRIALAAYVRTLTDFILDGKN